MTTKEAWGLAAFVLVSWTGLTWWGDWPVSGGFWPALLFGGSAALVTLSLATTTARRIAKRLVRR